MANGLLKREEFIHRKKDAKSEVDTIAQQLTNVYRQLSVLGEEAGEHFNQLLIKQATTEVLASLKTIPGGEEVREYYEFLTHTDTEETDSQTGKTQEDIIEGLLPKAEQISPVWETFGIVNAQNGAGPSSQQKPIQMSVVNPIRASVITSLANAPNASSLASAFGSAEGAAPPQQSKVDFPALQEDIDSAYERQKTEIMQALNYIVIDSNIEKMHQNLKRAINTVTENLNQLKDDLKQIVDDVSEKAAYPEFKEERKESKKRKEEPATEKIHKFRSGQKFSVDMSDNED